MLMTVPRAWRSPLVALGLVLAAILSLYRETVVAMVTIWYRSETFTHGFVVFPIVLWLIWRQRGLLANLVPRSSPWLLVLLAGFAMMWLLGDMVTVNSVTQLVLVAMLVVSVPAVLGLSVAAAIAFPLLFAFFAVPLGEFMLPQLMDWTADFTILALRASGIPVYREGLTFVIPSGNWSVVEACSGVRYLIASLTVGTLFAYLNYQSTRRRLLFVGVAILVPIVANWLRAYMIVMLGHLSGNTIAVGVDHLIYGWVFFGIVILLMFFIGARWAEPEPVATMPRTLRDTSDRAGPSSVRTWGVALGFVLIILLPILAKQKLESVGPLTQPVLHVKEPLSHAWKKSDAADFGYQPHFEGPNVVRNQVYESGDTRVGLYLAYYRDQDYSRKLVSSNNTLLRSNDQQWGRVGQGAAIASLNGVPITFRSADLRRLGVAVGEGPDKLRVWQIYWIHGRWTGSDYMAKVYGAVYQLLGRGDDSAAVIVYAPQDRADGADRVLAAFLKDNEKAIGDALRDTAAGR